MTTTTKNSITYTIATNEDYYGDAATTEDAERISKREASEVRKWMAAHHPEIELEIEFVPETQSLGNKSACYGDERFEREDGQAILTALNALVERNWFDW